MKTFKQRILEILESVLNDYKPVVLAFFICNGIIYQCLIHPEIDEETADDILKWFKSQKPTKQGKYKTFANNPLFRSDEAAWWCLDEDSKAQRVLFLKTLIKDLKEEHNL